jgi:transcriptional regulator with XRE-family HTH domain
VNGLKAARTARGWSQARVIHDMQRYAAAAGVPVASPDSLKTQLSRWENGHRMPDAVHRQILRAVFGMTDDQLGFTSPAGNTTDHVVGLVFPDNWQAGITSAADLWQGDMDRRGFLRGSAFVSAAFSTPVLHFLVSGDDSSPSSDVGNRLVGQPDVDSIREMTRAFRTLDNRHGGGCVRETVVRYLHAEVAPPAPRWAVHTGCRGEPVLGGGRAHAADRVDELRRRSAWLEPAVPDPGPEPR